MHHHDALERIKRRTAGANIAHLSYELTLDKKITFGRALTLGHAPSEAIAVARLMGVDENFVQLWERILREQS